MQGTWFPSLARDNIPLTVEQLSLCATIKTRHSQTNMSEKYGVSEDKTEQIIKNLVQKGVIYQPTNGYFKRVN